VETTPERFNSRPDPIGIGSSELIGRDGSAAIEPGLRTRRERRSRPLTRARQELHWVALLYLGTRVLLLVVAALFALIGHHNFLNELANWDGLWYREVANHGYPPFPSHAQTTLGFLPLYPIVIWVVTQVLSPVTGLGVILTATISGVLISSAGGLLAAVLVHRLAKGWWDERTARRATALFCLFPGSVVFSMVYSEGLLMPLAAGCLLALQQRRWLLAGVLAGFATAVEPTALVLIAVCAVSALRELRRRGWTDRAARRSLLAPALSVTGIAAFAVFLWDWTGTPLASYQAQHYGWKEKTDPLAVLHMTTRLLSQVSLSHFNEPTLNANLVVGVIGALLLIGMLALMYRVRREISIEAIVWTLGVSFLALTSEYTPPNPRLLITAFPALMVVARFVRGRWFTRLLWANCLALIGLSLMTFYGTTLRP
jgi:Mannosyltransferase (PIG-V)